ncbi:MAG TPA: hypothetical protein VHB79_20185 [Polyangiaceae bacterium]|nr:hypothetical protein [Polyangiaceae bacterium]
MLSQVLEMLNGAASVLLFRWSLGLAQSLVVAGSAECPAPSAVDARTREILGLSVNQVVAERATVSHEDAALRVTLRAADAHVLGERLLPAEGSCDEQAAAVAVLLAAWLSDVHPEYVGTLPEAPPTPVSAAPATERAPQSAAATPAVVAPPAVPSSRDSAAAKVASPPERPTQRRNLELGVAAGGVLSSASPAPFGSLGVRYLPESTGWGAALSGTFSTPRRTELSPGSVSYFRWPLVVGPALRASLGSTRLDMTAGPAGAWFHLSGVNFQDSRTYDVVVWGGALAARWALPQGRIAPFLEVSGMAFAGARAIVHVGTEERAVELPNLELYASLGASFRAW